jgi:hypothetical protein
VIARRGAGPFAAGDVDGPDRVFLRLAAPERGHAPSPTAAPPPIAAHRHLRLSLELGLSLTLAGPRDRGRDHGRTERILTRTVDAPTRMARQSAFVLSRQAGLSPAPGMPGRAGSTTAAAFDGGVARRSPIGAPASAEIARAFRPHDPPRALGEGTPSAGPCSRAAWPGVVRVPARPCGGSTQIGRGVSLPRREVATVRPWVPSAWSPRAAIEPGPSGREALASRELSTTLEIVRGVPGHAGRAGRPEGEDPVAPRREVPRIVREFAALAADRGRGEAAEQPEGPRPGLPRAIPEPKTVARAPALALRAVAEARAAEARVATPDAGRARREFERVERTALLAERLIATTRRVEHVPEAGNGPAAPPLAPGVPAPAGRVVARTAASAAPPRAPENRARHGEPARHGSPSGAPEAGPARAATLPPAEVQRLTESVVRALDQRLLAHRERFGRA